MIRGIEMDEKSKLDSDANLDGRPQRGRSGGKMLIFSALALVLVAAVILIVKSNGGESLIDTRSEETRKISTVQDKIKEADWIDVNLLPINEYSRPGIYLEEVNSIVIHNIGNPATTAAQNRSYFAGLAQSGQTYASSNFIIDLDGGILECVPVDEVAYCSNIRNEDSISIECCHPDDSGEFSAETYESVVRLTAWLCVEFELTADDVIRHYDITGKECPLYYVKNEDEWDRLRDNVAEEIDSILASHVETVAD